MPLFGGPPDVGMLLARRDVKGLIKALRYRRSAVVRRDAARGLGHLGDARAVKRLIAALRDVDPEVQAAAVEALGHLGEPASSHSSLPCTLNAVTLWRRAQQRRRWGTWEIPGR
jgi:HEAT repeat protein